MHFFEVFSFSFTTFQEQDDQGSLSIHISARKGFSFSFFGGKLECYFGGSLWQENLRGWERSLDDIWSLVRFYISL